MANITIDIQTYEDVVRHDEIAIAVKHTAMLAQYPIDRVNELAMELDKYYPGIVKRVVQRQVVKGDLIQCIKDAMEKKVPGKLAKDLKEYRDWCDREHELAASLGKMRMQADSLMRAYFEIAQVLQTFLGGKVRSIATWSTPTLRIVPRIENGTTSISTLEVFFDPTKARMSVSVSSEGEYKVVSELKPGAPQFDGNDLVERDYFSLLREWGGEKQVQRQVTTKQLQRSLEDTKEQIDLERSRYRREEVVNRQVACKQCLRQGEQWVTDVAVREDEKGYRVLTEQGYKACWNSECGPFDHLPDASYIETIAPGQAAAARRLNYSFLKYDTKGPSEWRYTFPMDAASSIKEAAFYRIPSGYLEVILPGDQRRQNHGNMVFVTYPSRLHQDVVKKHEAVIAKGEARDFLARTFVDTLQSKDEDGRFYQLLSSSPDAAADELYQFAPEGGKGLMEAVSKILEEEKPVVPVPVTGGMCPLVSAWEGCKGSVLEGEPNLLWYDIILINTSAGKDSQAMLTTIVEKCEQLGIKDRIVCVHADLGPRVEWDGTAELAEYQVKKYGLRFEKVKRTQERDLLEHVEKRGMWPGFQTRYCTADHKRGPIRKLMTQLVREVNPKVPHEEKTKRGKTKIVYRKLLDRRVRILNCMGLRAQEGPGRSKMDPWTISDATNDSVRIVHDWLPIHDWLVEDVWECIKRSGLPHHFAYDLGIPRLSCTFCFYAPFAALVVTGQHNEDKLREWAAVERRIGHTLRVDYSLNDILAAVESGEEVELTSEWGEGG